MGRKRMSRKDLPERMYLSHKSYFFVDRNNKWLMLGKSLPEALKAYGEMMEPDNITNMGQVFDRYMAEIVSAQKFNTAKGFRVAIPRLKAVFGDIKPLSIRPKDIYKYRDMRERKSGKAQAQDEMAKLSTIMTKAIEWGVIERNYCKELKALSLPPRERYVTDDEFNRIYHAADARMKCIMDIGYQTGLRISDILKIKLSDIQKNELSVTTQKTGKRVAYQLIDDLAIAIDRAKKLPKRVDSIFLFTKVRGKKISYKSFNTHWNEVLETAGLQDADIIFHDIRAKAATDAGDMGVDAQTLLGHKHRAMTEGYIKARQIDKVTPLKKVRN
jgi:integrase